MSSVKKFKSGLSKILSVKYLYSDLQATKCLGLGMDPGFRVPGLNPGFLQN